MEAFEGSCKGMIAGYRRTRSFDLAMTSSSMLDCSKRTIVSIPFTARDQRYSLKISRLHKL